MKRKLGGEVTIKETRFKDPVFEEIRKYWEKHGVGFSVAVHEVVTAGFEAVRRQEKAASEAAALKNEISVLRLKLRNIEKATRDLGEQVFPEYVEDRPETIYVQSDLSGLAKYHSVDSPTLEDMAPPEEEITGPLSCFRCGEKITGDNSYPARAKMHVHLADCNPDKEGSDD